MTSVNTCYNFVTSVLQEISRDTTQYARLLGSRVMQPLLNKFIFTGQYISSKGYWIAPLDILCEEAQQGNPRKSIKMLSILITNSNQCLVVKTISINYNNKSTNPVWRTQWRDMIKIRCRRYPCLWRYWCWKTYHFSLPQYT